jgi:phosphatidylserine/phosphatidylglycerophosphate/cardiolipin synthase-like enzyme
MMPKTPDDVYNLILDKLEKDGHIKPSYLSDKLPPYLLEHGILYLNYLVSLGNLSKTTKGTDEEYTVISLEGLIKQKEETSKPSPEVRESLVVNVPLSLSSGLERLIRRYDFPIIKMKDAFRDLLNKAKDEVLLAVPFLEEDGVMFFYDQLESLGKKNIRTKVLTRGILEPENEYGYNKKLRTFARLLDIYESRCLGAPNIEIRDFTESIGEGHSPHYEGIHQKMIVVDRRLAYIGSGEIRGPSFIANGDVGVIHVGDKAGFWAEFFDLFWAKAEKVDTSIFHALK